MEGCQQNGAVVEAESQTIVSSIQPKRIRIVEYENEHQMGDIMRLITKVLSEPYSIYTYRYFIHNWPKLCLLVSFYLFLVKDCPLTCGSSNWTFIGDKIDLTRLLQRSFSGHSQEGEGAFVKLLYKWLQRVIPMPKPLTLLLEQFRGGGGVSE